MKNYLTKAPGGGKLGSQFKGPFHDGFGMAAKAADSSTQCSLVRKQGDMGTNTQLGLFYLFSPGPQLYHPFLRRGLPTSISLIHKIVHGDAQWFVPMTQLLL